MIYYDGDAFEGECEDGKMHGHFVITYLDGMKEEGQWVAGKGRQGEWTYTEPDGTVTKKNYN